MKTLSNNTVVAISVLLILFPLGFSVVGSAFSLVGANPEPFLEKPGGNHTSCFSEMTPPGKIMKKFDKNRDGKLDEEEETALRDSRYMRFHHMGILRDVREAVREGIRGEMTLNDCWECHANAEHGTSRERFCDRCHDAVNLQLNCFGCHHDPQAAAETGN